MVVRLAGAPGSAGGRVASREVDTTPRNSAFASTPGPRPNG